MSLFVTQKMRGKMTGFKSLNTSPMGNSYCDRMSQNPANICSKCYSRKMVQAFECDQRWIENGNILKKRGALIATHQLPKLTGIDYFRFHSHGELINSHHLINLCIIAWEYPDTTFALWSKRKDIIKVAKLWDNSDKVILQGRKIIPPNLVLMYSDPKINSLSTRIPLGFDKKFTVFTKEFAKENNIEINCGGKRCMECLLCYDKNNGVKYINEHLK